MDSFRKHRIDPYGPDALGPMKTTLTGSAWTGGEVAPDNPASGDRCLVVEDTSETVNISANYVKPIPVDRDRVYVLRIKARTLAETSTRATPAPRSGPISSASSPSAASPRAVRPWS